MFKAYLPPLGHFVFVICDLTPSFESFPISFFTNTWFPILCAHGLGDFRAKDASWCKFRCKDASVMFYYSQTIAGPKKIFFFKDFIFNLLSEREEGGRKRGRETLMCERNGNNCCRPPTGDLAYTRGMCPEWESDQRPFSSQACTQSTEPHQPGYTLCF